MSAGPAPLLRPGGRGSPLRRVLRTAAPVRLRLLLAAVLGALAVGSSVGLLATSAFLISKAALQPPILHLQVAIVAVRAFGIGRGVFRYAERLIGHDAAFRSLTDLRVAVYDRLAVIAPAGTSAYRSGDLLSRMVADVDAMVDLYLRVALPYLVAVLVGVGSVLLVAAFVPAAGLALAVALLIGGAVVPALTLGLLRRSQARVSPAMGALSAQTVAMLDASAEITVLGQQQRFLEDIRASDGELTAAASRAARSTGAGSALGIAAQGFAVVAAIVFGTEAVSSGALAGVNLALVVLVPLAAYEAVQVLPAAVVVLLRVRESARRIVAVVDSPDPVPDPPQPAPPPPAAPAVLRVRGLRAGWRPGDWTAGPVDLELPPGSTTALVGPSGSGKSTLAAALARMVPSSGEVCFGGADLGRLSGEAVRRIIGLAQQDPYLFDTTIAENVRLAHRSATDAEILAALADLGLSPWLTQLPEGIETTVGRFGRQLSGGQRRRIALARILVADAAVVVVDEPTEHLDAATADLVMTALLRRCADRALLVITHREADAARCDRIVRIGGPAQ